jgi:threonine dehydrogenase-like Zn-dependent dehydrogenase
MRAYLVTAPNRSYLADLDTPVPGPGEVLVAPAAVGICGSDIELRDGRRPPGYVRYPVVPGHEWAGHVVSTGSGVTGLEPGVPVVAEGIRACGRCDRCAEGRNNLCTGPYAETGFTHPGALAERIVVPAGLLHPLPAGRPIAAAALIEPAACVATGLFEVGYPAPGGRVAVVGDGPVGLLAVALLRLGSPRELVMFGTRPERAGYAHKLGATDVVLRSDPELAALGRAGPPLPRDPHGGFDLVLEATNSATGAASAIGLARRAGTVVLLGISGIPGPTLHPDAISLNHLRVQGVFAASRTAWRWLVSLYAAGLFDPVDLISHRFGLERVDEAFAVLADRDAGALKVVVEPAA